MPDQASLEGLKWVEESIWGIEPRWTVEPDVGSIIRTVERLRPSLHTSRIEAAGAVNVSFLAQGAFNKLYNIQCGDEHFIIHVSLPVDPKHKTSSEVATVEWVRKHTGLPVPQILTYNDNRDNEIQFEWILMTKLPGRPLADLWRSMSWPAKERIVEHLAQFSASTFRKQLRGIGNIYPQTSDSGKKGDDVERIVSMLFFWGDNLSRDVPRGPFRSSQGWINARLSLMEHDCRSDLAKWESKKKDADSDDEDEHEDAERTLKIIERLKPYVADFFPENENADIPEPSMMFHGDLSKHNILVGDDGALRKGHRSLAQQRGFWYGEYALLA